MTKIDVTYWHLTFDDDDQNSHKFYDVYAVGNDVILRWGRVGTNGQYSTEQYRSVMNAESAARTQVNKKTGNGYHLKVNERVSIESNYLDPYDLAYKVEHALKAHEKPTAVSNRLASLTAAAVEIAGATNRKATAGLLTSWNSIQKEWEEISIEYRHAEAAMQEAEQVITQRLLGG